jgi:hypothetical protein
VGYDEIRAALNRGFSVNTLNEVTRLGHDLLASDTALTHPIVPYALAATAQKIAARLDGQHAAADSISIVESHIRPQMIAVLDAAQGPTSRLMEALDNLARAYSESISFLA